MIKATIAVYLSVSEVFLPTPTKAHYLFNLRDMAKVVQGCLRATPIAFGSSDQYLQLWVHECLRVFQDRLADANDKLRFNVASARLLYLNTSSYLYDEQNFMILMV